MRRDPYMKSLPSSKSHSRVIIFAFCPKSYQNLNPDFGFWAICTKTFHILVPLLVLRKFHLGDADVDCWWWRCRCWQEMEKPTCPEELLPSLPPVPAICPDALPWSRAALPWSRVAELCTTWWRLLVASFRPRAAHLMPPSIILSLSQILMPSQFSSNAHHEDILSTA